MYFVNVYQFMCGFENGMWGLIVLVPDSCLPFYFAKNKKQKKKKKKKKDACLFIHLRCMLKTTVHIIRLKIQLKCYL